MNFHNVGFSFTWYHVVRYVENGTKLPTPGAKWRKNVSAIRVTIGSDDGLSPACRQAITWANNALSWITPRGTHFNTILSYTDIFYSRKYFIKVVCKMSAILCWSQYIDTVSKNTWKATAMVTVQIYGTFCHIIQQRRYRRLFRRTVIIS